MPHPPPFATTALGTIIPQLALLQSMQVTRARSAKGGTGLQISTLEPGRARRFLHGWNVCVHAQIMGKGYKYSKFLTGQDKPLPYCFFLSSTTKLSSHIPYIFLNLLLVVFFLFGSFSPYIPQK